MDKKYQVFVSSTFRDLVDERQDAIRNVLDLKHIPAGMELFPATDVEQLTYIKKVIDECDYYLLIMGGRYGSMDAEGVSYTEREYDYAIETGKVVIAFVHDDPAAIPVGKSDTDAAVVAALTAFRQKVMSGRLVKGWTTRQNLEPLVLKALVHAFNDIPQIGWIRGDQAASQSLLEQSNSLLQENAQLRKELRDAKVAIQPQMEGIAGLAATYTVHYTHKQLRATTKTSATIELTWSEIAVGIASVLETPKTAVVIDAAVSFAIKRRGLSRSSVDVNDVDVKTIKVQLEALGIVKVQTLSLVGGGSAEFMTLTAKGRAHYLESMVVREVLAVPSSGSPDGG